MALNRDRDTVERSGKQLNIDVAAGVTIFTGALVAVNTNGFLVPGASTAGLKAVGRAEGYTDNSSGANGAESVNVKRGTFKFDNDGTIPVEPKDLFDVCYIKDDCTVRGKDTAAGAVNITAGKVLGIEEDGVWVEI